MRGTSSPALQPPEIVHSLQTGIFSLSLLIAFFIGSCFSATAQANGVGQQPYLGWSSFSQQTISGNFLTQANIAAQSDALAASGLQSHGFTYINIDSGWMGSFDGNGRPIPNTATFPDIKALVDHIHSNGQKAGIYWIPGIEQPAVDVNYPILGTQYHIQDILVVPHVPGNAFSAGQNPPYHNKIDFTKPGAQEYMNSVVNLFASWGIDFIKLDGVTPGSYNDDLNIDNRADVEAWSKAIAQSGRPIWLTISWALDKDYLNTWQQYANARRIEDDVECEGNCSTLTDWARVGLRFSDLVGWQDAASNTLGWNDLDSLDVINGSTDGITNQEKQSAITLWAMANAPIYLGGDLTALDDTGKQLLSNDEVIAVDQSTHPAQQVLGGTTPIWASSPLNDGSYYVALFNLNAFPAPVTIPWNMLGFVAATQVRDLWNHTNLGASPLAFSTVIPGHSTRLLKVTPRGYAPPPASQGYEAEAAVLSGSATISSCSGCSGGQKVGFLGNGANNNVTFTNVRVPRAGTYLMQVDSMTIGPRSLLFSVNGGPLSTLNLSGGSFNLPSSTTVPVHLNAGVNSIRFGNPTSYASDLDRIVISGNGSAPLPFGNTYEAENAIFTGTAGPAFCNLCSGVSKAGNIGGTSTVIFSNVTVPSTGAYQLEIDYMTSGPRSFQMTVNNGASTQLDFNGSSFSSPVATVIQVQLNAGQNTIQFSNPSSFAPDLDKIVVAPILQQ